jgi:D-glycero-D-manno-heptose 1,7-bisphosphate phosphatase
MSPRPAVFFDRDGVVNLSPGSSYVTSVEDFHLMPGIIEVLAWCKAQGYYTVLVTSQQGVGKGLMSRADLDEIHAFLQTQLAAQGASFDLIRSCTHLDGTCTCRKPSPQMILDAASFLSIDIPNSVMIGDHDRDILMGRNAGVGHTIRLAGEKEVKEPGDTLVHSIPELHAALKLLPLDGSRLFKIGLEHGKQY